MSASSPPMPEDESAVPSPPPSPLPVQLLLHGAPRLRVGTQELPLDRKAAGVVTWLALRGPALRERLAELLWPEAGAEAARNSLRQLLFRLKRIAGTAIVDGQAELRLAPFVQRPAGTGQPVGELLEGCRFDDCPAFADWLAGERQAQREHRLTCRLAAIDDATAAGDTDAALAAARALAQDEPQAEAAQMRLVQVLYLRGDRTAALQTAAQAQQRLREALDAEPSAAFLALVDTVRSAGTEPPRAASLPAPMPAAVLRPPRLVGRDAELAALAQARQEGRVGLVLGEPGMGKSRLLAEAAAHTPGVLSLSTRPGDAGMPYAAMARWLRTLLDHPAGSELPLPQALHRLLPERAEAHSADSAGHRNALVPALAQVFGAAAAAGVRGLWVDDLHFADPASLDALLTLLDEPALAGWHWCLARRPAEGGEPLTRLVDALLDADRLLPLRLEPLDGAGVHALLCSLQLPGLHADALAPRLAQATGGNPMFVLETLKAMLVRPDGLAGEQGAALPRSRSVGALIARRLQQLSPGALALARMAALAGPDFSAELAVQVLQRPLMSLADDWAELEAAQVLREHAFAHDLIFEATLAGIPAPIRRQGRRAIAEFLASRPAEPQRLAEHWLAAGEPGRAAPLFEAAGRRAEAAARYAEALELFERSAGCHDDDGHPERAFDTRLALADLLMEARQYASSQTLVDELMAAPGPVDQRLRLVIQQVNLHLRQSRPQEATDAASIVLADEDLLEDATPFRVATLRWTLAVALIGCSDDVGALHQLQLAHAELAECSDASWRCWYHGQVAVAMSGGGSVSAALAAQQQSIAAARVVGRRRMVAGCLQNSATFASVAGRLVQAVEHLDEALLLMSDTGGDDHFSAWMMNQRARLLVPLGRYGEALETLQTLTQPNAPLNPEARAVGLAALAQCWALLGQPARAAPLLHAADAALSDKVPGIAAQMASYRCEVAWLAGEDSQALAKAAAMAGASATFLGELQQLRSQGEAVEVTPLAARRARWQAAGLGGTVVVADVLIAAGLLARGDAAAAAASAGQALNGLRQSMLAGMYRPWLLMEIARCAEPADPALARRALDDGITWVHNVARFQLPPALRAGFLQRNRINAQLLARTQG